MRNGGQNIQMSIMLNARPTTTNGTNFPKSGVVRWSFHFRRHFHVICRLVLPCGWNPWRRCLDLISSCFCSLPHCAQWQTTAGGASPRSDRCYDESDGLLPPDGAETVRLPHHLESRWFSTFIVLGGQEIGAARYRWLSSQITFDHHLQTRQKNGTSDLSYHVIDAPQKILSICFCELKATKFMANTNRTVPALCKKEGFPNNDASSVNSPSSGWQQFAIHFDETKT